MKYIQRLFFIQILLIQSIFGYDYDFFDDHNDSGLLIHSEVYHCNDDCCYPVLIYTGFFDNSVHFNTKPQPEMSNPQPKVVHTPPPVRSLIDPSYFPRNDDRRLKEPPRFFCDQPQSNVTYCSFDNKRPFVGSHRTPFALMSTKELAHHFAFLEYSQEQILDEYQLYLNDSFINFVKDFPEYEATLKNIAKSLHSMGFGKSLLNFSKKTIRSALQIVCKNCAIACQKSRLYRKNQLQTLT